MTNEEMERLLDVSFTFSHYCRSGLQPRCECWRCRQSRGEPVTDETERIAELQAKAWDNRGRL